MRTEKLLLSSDGTKMFLGGKGASNAPLPELPGVYPNPSQGETYLTYTLPEGMDVAEVEVFDATGRMIWQQVTGQISGIVRIPIALRAGLYQGVLRSNGSLVGSTKFTVVH